MGANDLNLELNQCRGLDTLRRCLCQRFLVVIASPSVESGLRRVLDGRRASCARMGIHSLSSRASQSLVYSTLGRGSVSKRNPHSALPCARPHTICTRLHCWSVLAGRATGRVTELKRRSITHAHTLCSRPELVDLAPGKQTTVLIGVWYDIQN